MAYQDLPDPRPFGARVALGRMPRWAALAVTGALACLGLATAVACFADEQHVAVWGVVSVAAFLAAGNYVAAIRWVDFHKMWPRRGSHHRRNRTLL